MMTSLINAPRLAPYQPVEDNQIGRRSDQTLQLAHELALVTASGLGRVADDTVQPRDTKAVELDVIAVEDVRARRAETPGLAPANSRY